MTKKRLTKDLFKEFRFNEKEIDLINSFIIKYPKGRMQSAILESLFLAQKKSGG